jgi:hypothetical protein
MGDKSFVGDELELQETMKTTTTFNDFNQTTIESVSENKADNLEFFNETIILKVRSLLLRRRGGKFLLY